MPRSFSVDPDAVVMLTSPAGPGHSPARHSQLYAQCGEWIPGAKRTKAVNCQVHDIPLCVRCFVPEQYVCPVSPVTDRSHSADEAEEDETDDLEAA